MSAPRLHVVVVEPKIAGNVGALVRLCAATDCALHICGALGFSPDDKRMRRAGLDTWPHAEVYFHHSAAHCDAVLAWMGAGTRWTVEVGGTKAPWDVQFVRGDVVVFGPEDGSAIPDNEERRLTLPMHPRIRSLNLAQTAAVIAYQRVHEP